MRCILGVCANSRIQRRISTWAGQFNLDENSATPFPFNIFPASFIYLFSRPLIPGRQAERGKVNLLIYMYIFRLVTGSSHHALGRGDNRVRIRCDVNPGEAVLARCSRDLGGLHAVKFGEGLKTPIERERRGLIPICLGLVLVKRTSHRRV